MLVVISLLKSDWFVSSKKCGIVIRKQKIFLSSIINFTLQHIEDFSIRCSIDFKRKFLFCIYWQFTSQLIFDVVTYYFLCIDSAGRRPIITQLQIESTCGSYFTFYESMCLNYTLFLQIPMQKIPKYLIKDAFNA